MWFSKGRFKGISGRFMSWGFEVVSAGSRKLSRRFKGCLGRVLRHTKDLQGVSRGIGGLSMEF